MPGIPALWPSVERAAERSATGRSVLPKRSTSTRLPYEVQHRRPRADGGEVRLGRDAPASPTNLRPQASTQAWELISRRYVSYICLAQQNGERDARVALVTNLAASYQIASNVAGV